jgi:PAB-dependent poly(A)-specific ribonuclease subunit 3
VVRFNNVGITDVLEFESRKTLTELQIDDLIKLGYLILSLAARATVGPKNVDQAVSLLQQHFSEDMQNVVATLLSGKSAASQVCHLISERINDEFDSAMAASDALHSHLRNEYENGRMLRLLVKMGFMNERPEYTRAPQWSETGDRYVLKLFRDYVFHQVYIYVYLYIHIYFSIYVYMYIYIYIYTYIHTYPYVLYTYIPQSLLSGPLGWCSCVRC